MDDAYDDMLLALAHQAEGGLGNGTPSSSSLVQRGVQGDLAGRPAAGAPGPSRALPAGASRRPATQPGVIPVRSEQPAEAARLTGAHRIAAFQQPRPDKAQQGFADVGQGSVIERLSGLKIKNPLVSSSQVQARFADAAALKLSQVRPRHRATGLDGMWATIGVLGEKSKPRESSSGNQFSIWKLTDLDQTCVSLFLFGSAHAELRKEAVGSLVAVFKPKVKADGEFSLSVESGAQVWLLGGSKDFGYCKATKKDGEPCRMPVNTTACDYCSYHVQREYNKLKPARRGDFQESNLKTAFRQMSGKGLQWQPGVFESAPRVQQHMPTMTQEQLRGVADRASNRGSASGARYVRTVADPAAALAAQQEQAAAADGRRAAPGRCSTHVPMLGPSGRGGSVVLPLKRKAAETGPAALAGTVLLDDDVFEDDARSRAAEMLRAATLRPAPAPAPASASATAVPEFLQAGLERLRQVQEAERDAASGEAGPASAAEPTDRAATRPMLPVGGRQASAGAAGSSARAPLASRQGPPPPQQRPVGGGAGSGKHPAPARQPAPPVTGGGGIRPSLLNKLGLAAGSKKAVPTSKAQEARQPPASAFEAAFGGVIKEMEAHGPVQRGSRYRELVEDEDHDRLMAVVGALEKKDEMAQRMDAIMHLEVQAVRCGVCQYVSERRRPECAAHPHAVERLTATKRWWQCEGCGHRFDTVAVRLPRKGCARCQHPGATFKAVSMFRPPRQALAHEEAPVAAREQLRPRGVEQKWVG